jgi:integrase
MSGTVYRRGAGWEYRFDLPPDSLTGKRRRTTKAGFATRQLAEKAMREAIRAAEHGQHVKHSTRTVSEFLNDWLVAMEGRMRRSTWSSYRDYRDAYVNPVIGLSSLQELTPVRLNLLYSQLLKNGRKKKTENSEDGLAPKTVRNVHVMLRRALRDAVRWGYLPVNPAENAEPPTGHSRKRTVWTAEELKRFIQHCQGDRFYALWLLAVTTGLRRGELAGLRLCDVDLADAKITPAVPRVVVDGYAEESEPKTARGYRRLSLDPLTVAALRKHVLQWTSERAEFGDTARQLLFCWPDGSSMHPQTITDRFKGLAAAAGLPPIRLHDVRHSYATAALAAGVHPKIVSERLGHASVAFTLQTYSHVLEGMDSAAAAQVADHIFGKGGPPATTESPLAELPREEPEAPDTAL